MFLKRKPKLKSLTLRQVHELYLVLRHALPEEDEKLLVEEVRYILKHAIPGTMMSALKIMYDSVPEDVNALVATGLLMNGLNKSKFFAYVTFLRKLNNHAR